MESKKILLWYKSADNSIPKAISRLPWLRSRASAVNRDTYMYRNTQVMWSGDSITCLWFPQHATFLEQEKRGIALKKTCLRTTYTHMYSCRCPHKDPCTIPLCTQLLHVHVQIVVRVYAAQDSPAKKETACPMHSVYAQCIACMQCPYS